MTVVDRLHPALQHHIVNSLGWRTLRPFQEQSIEPLLLGKHAILLAPTAGGKTEAALLPVLSRMLAENWNGLSVLYLCPIRALLNNLHDRLSRYFDLIGRRCNLWHGDIGQGAKRRFLKDCDDCLLTTPESLEVMLVSRGVDRHALFRDLRVVIVDEVHSFAGDDRGWHLLSLLERVTKIAGRELQRIGLSATVGNPAELLQWLSGHCQGPGVVINSLDTRTGSAEVKLDFVGSLENASLVISRLHRGEKRLVFCDSRSQAEQVAARLRQLSTRTFVSHSSLSADERRQAETAFNSESDCVIVATSTLELGVDVGDLDHVIQIDAPTTVAAFLQRMGRTGRRTGTSPNCLFLATSRATLLRAAGLIDLWAAGYVERVRPPVMPFHLLAQQIMALALQEGGIGRFTWWDWIGRMPGFAALSESDRNSVLSYMLEQNLLSEDQGILWLGRTGENEFGRKNFVELFSVFKSPPLFSVRWGNTELGEVHESSFLVRTYEKPVLLLGGRGWLTTKIDWAKRVAYVEPSDEIGQSRWIGSGQPLSFSHCQAIKRVLCANDLGKRLSQRASTEVDDARRQFDWLSVENTAIVVDGSRESCHWWTFAGLRANAMLAESLRDVRPSSFDNLCIRFDCTTQIGVLEGAISHVRNNPPTRAPLTNLDKAADELKFSICLPSELVEHMLATRLSDTNAVKSVLAQPIRSVVSRTAGSRGVQEAG